MVLLASLVTAVAVAAAPSGGVHPPRGECAQAPSAAAQIQCLRGARLQAERELAIRLREVRGALGATPHLQEALDRSQASWRVYLRDTCSGLAGPYWRPGPARLLAETNCELRLTRERTLDLGGVLSLPARG